MQCNKLTADLNRHKQLPRLKDKESEGKNKLAEL